MKRFKHLGLKTIVAAATTATVALSITLPMVSNSSNVSTKAATAKNDTDAVVWAYEPLNIASGYTENVISTNKTATTEQPPGYKKVHGVDDPNNRDNGTQISAEGSDVNGACLFVQSTAGGTTHETYKGLDDPVDGFITIDSEATPTTTGALSWKIPCTLSAEETPKNNAMKLWGKSTASTATGTFTFTDLGVYQKLYILCILSQCNSSSGKIKATINYTDNTTDSAEYTLYDWFPSSSNLTKLKEAGLFATDDYARCYFYGSSSSLTTEWNSGGKDGEVVFNQVPITVNTSKVIKSLDINLSQRYDEDTTLTVYGVSGQYASNINPPTVTVSNVKNTTATVNWTKPTSGDDPEKYYLDIYHYDASGNLVYDISSKEFDSSVLTYNLTGLSEHTKYYAVMRSGITDSATTSIVQSESSSPVDFTTTTGVTTVSVPDTTIYVGDTGKTLTTTCYGADGTTLSTDQTLSSIVCSPTDVVTLTKQSTSTSTTPQVYDITINKAGTVTVTATSTDGGVTGTGEIDVKVRAPTATAATDLSYTGFTANWSAVTGAEGYYIDVATDSGFGSSSMVLSNVDVGNVTSYAIPASAGLKQSTTYYYRVRAYNNSVNSENSNTISVKTNELLPPTLTSLVKSSPSYSALVANIEKSSSASTTDYTYTLEISTKEDFSTITKTVTNIAYTTTQEKVSNLSENTTYYARIKTVYGNLTSDWSAIKSVTLDSIPPVSIECPSTLSLDINESKQISTTIKGPDGTTPTNQNVTITPSEADFLTITTVSTGKHLITANKAKASPSGTVTLVVSADADPTVTATCVVTINFPKPVLTVTGHTAETISLSWAKITGAQTYTLSFGEGGSYIDITNIPSTVTSWTIDDWLKPNTEYNIYITAYNNGVASMSAVIQQKTDPQAATGLTITPETAEVLVGQQLTVTSQVLGATYEATSQAVTSAKTSGDATVALTDNNKNHTITVTDEGTDNAAVVTYTVTEETSYTKTCSVTVKKAQASAYSSLTAYSFTANWVDVGAPSYELDVSTDPSFGSYVPGYQAKSVTGSSCEVTDLSPRTDYYYRIRYVNGTYKSKESGTISLHTPTDITALEIDKTSESVLLGQELAVTSTVKYGTASSKDQVVTSEQTSGDATTDLTDDKQNHTITVTDEGTDNSAVVRYTVTNDTSYTKDCTLTVKKAEALTYTNLRAYNFTANWTDVGADSYELDVAYDENFNNYVTGYQAKSVTGSSSVVSGLSPRTNYYYRVRYVNNGITSKNSATISLKTPTDIDGFEIDTTSKSVLLGEEITVKSDVKYGATSSKDQDVISTQSGGNANVDLTDNNTIHTVLATDEGTDNLAVVKYIVNTDKSFNKECRITITKAQTKVATDITSYSFTANWTDVGAESYKLDVATDENFTNYVPGYENRTVLGNTINISGLSAKTTYYYRVRYINNGYTSKNSAVESATTPTDVTGLAINKEQLSITTDEPDESLFATVSTIDPSGKSVKWSISDESIAKLEIISANDNESHIRVVGLSDGTATIAASIEGYPEIASVSCQLTVTDSAIGAPDPKVKDVSTSGFTIYWDEIESKYPVTYIVNVWYVDEDFQRHHVVMDVATTKTEIVISKDEYSLLQDGKKYYLTVEAINKNASALSDVVEVNVPKYIPWPIIIGATTGTVGGMFFVLLPALYILWKNSIIVTIDPKKAKRKVAKGENNAIDKMFRVADKFWVAINVKITKRSNSLMTRLGTKKEQKL